MKRKTGSLLALAMALIMVLSSVSFVFAATEFKQADGKIITSAVENNIAPGIDEEFVTTADSDGTNQNKTYICTVDPSVTTIGIMASYRNYNSSGSWGMQTVRDQAKAAEKATGKKIVFAMNADYYNMNNGQPLGALVMKGKVVHETSGEPYFAILKNGQAVIRDANVSLDDVQEAVGSPFYLVRDGKVTPNAVDSYMMPRAAVGIKSNGELVFLINDGRQAPYSCGMGTKELAESLVNSGCVTALYLDGGGSATFLSRSEGESELTLKNKPSDGVERAVSSALLIYSDARSDGKLARVSISPKEEVYTPGSTIEFKAKGIDSTGERANLPSDGKFILKDKSYGSIDSSSGKFVSSGKEGTVTVQYELFGKVYGSANIEIRKPDSISFANSEVALAFGEESTLGLDVKWKHRDVNYKVGDFNWNISNPAMGRMDGNTFIASDSETVNGGVTCTYKESNVSGKIAVIVGKEPTVVMDFEDYVDESGNITLAKDYWTIGRATFTPNGGLITSYLDNDGNPIDNPNTKLLVGSYKDDGSPYVNRGSQESANIANLSDGDPVRKGAHSLQINYDFTNNDNSTDEDRKAIDGACVGFSEQTSLIPGTPTGIGMYVYAPEGTLNLWLRIRVRDGKGTVQTVNFVADKESDPDGKKGINWTGWKYVEADLSKYSGPYQLIGGESIRPMYHLGGGYGDKDAEGNYVPKSQRKGSIYVDNLQFVYGTNTEDVDAPVINSVLANSNELTDGSVVESNTVNFIATTEDIDNRYTSGIDSNSANVFLDGVNISKDGANFVDNEFRVTGLKVPDGEHTIQFLVRDKNGNETTKSIDFTVDYKPVTEVDGSLKLPMINVTDEGVAYLGKTGNIVITAADATDMSTVTSTIKLGSGYSDYEVEYADGFEEVEPPKYKKKDNSVTISVAKKENANVDKNAPIAKLKVKIPFDADANNSLTYRVASGNYKIKDNEGVDKTLTFSTKARKIALKSKYKLEVATLIEGFDAKIIVRDEKGEPIKGVSVYGKGKDQSDFEMLGTTDANGELSTSKYREPQTVCKR